jgi:aspartate racemase
VPRLLLATTGTRAARLFERHPRWSELAPWLRLPDDWDQAALHEWLYRLKHGEPLAGSLGWLDTLPLKNGVEGFVLGCTELHLLQRLVEGRTDGPWAPGKTVDPLLTAARGLTRLLPG